MLLIQLSTWGCVWGTQFWEVGMYVCNIWHTFSWYVGHFYKDLEHLWLKTGLSVFLSWHWNKKAVTEKLWIKIPALFKVSPWVLSPMLNLDVHYPSCHLCTWTLTAGERLTERLSEEGTLESSRILFCVPGRREVAGQERWCNTCK